MIVRSFKGLNNVGDPMRLGLAWLTQANNVDISSSGALSKRSGYAQTLAGSITGAYGSIDLQRMYFVDGGTLKTITGKTLRTGLNPAPMYWAEVNNHTYFNNGIDRGIIAPDDTFSDWAWSVPGTPTLAAVTGNLAAGTYQVMLTYTLPDLRETGSGEPARITLTAGQALQITDIPQIAGYRTNVYIAPADSTVYQYAATPLSTAMVWSFGPDNLGRDLLTDALDPLPLGTDVIQAWRGRLYAASYMPSVNQTAIWASQPLGYHLFNLRDGFTLVPGRVLALAPHDDALIVGTDSRIFAFDGKALEQLADYGVIPGWSWAMDGKTVMLWTQRGACSALPFKNLTEDHVSVAPGLQAGAAVVSTGGQKKFVVALHAGGTAFNQRD